MKKYPNKGEPGYEEFLARRRAKYRDGHIPRGHVGHPEYENDLEKKRQMWKENASRREQASKRHKEYMTEPGNRDNFNNVRQAWRLNRPQDLQDLECLKNRLTMKMRREKRLKSPFYRAKMTIKSSEETAKLKGDRLPITSSVEDVMRVQEQTVCAVCGEEPKKICTDHDHDTGKVRDMLCVACNQMARSLAKVEAILAYIKKHKT